MGNMHVLAACKAMFKFDVNLTEKGIESDGKKGEKRARRARKGAERKRS
jgi:hypothetical protein